MRRFRDEEHAFRTYAAMMSRSGISGVDPIAMRGVEYAKVCPNCKGTNWHEQDGVQRCRGFRCGRPRPWKMVGVPRGYFEENPRRHSGNVAIERCADLGLAFQVLTLWEFRVWWAYVATGDYRRAFHFCRVTWPRRVEGWSLQRVKVLTDQAREHARPELRRRGLIEI